MTPGGILRKLSGLKTSACGGAFCICRRTPYSDVNFERVYVANNRLGLRMTLSDKEL